MAESKKDNNQVNTITGVLNTDGTTPTLIKATPSTHIVDTSDGTSGSDAGNDDAARDANQVPVLLAVSEDDGSTPVPVYVNSNGEILIDQT
jgi:hypothetical protein